VTPDLPERASGGPAALRSPTMLPDRREGAAVIDLGELVMIL